MPNMPNMLNYAGAAFLCQIKQTLPPQPHAHNAEQVSIHVELTHSAVLMTPSKCKSPDMDMKWPTLTRYTVGYCCLVQFRDELSYYIQSLTPQLLLTAPNIQESLRARFLVEASNPTKAWVTQWYRSHQVARSCDDFTSLCCSCMLLIQHEGREQSRKMTPAASVPISPNYGDLLLMGSPTSAPTRKVRVV